MQLGNFECKIWNEILSLYLFDPFFLIRKSRSSIFGKSCQSFGKTDSECLVSSDKISRLVTSLLVIQGRGFLQT